MLRIYGWERLARMLRERLTEEMTVTADGVSLHQAILFALWYL